MSRIRGSRYGIEDRGQGTHGGEELDVAVFLDELSNVSEEFADMRWSPGPWALKQSVTSFELVSKTSG